MLRALVVGLIVTLAPFASGQMVITEWMYSGSGTNSAGEFIEFTNIGLTSIDMTGWSFDDDSALPGTVSLSAFGVVAPGESVILTDETAEIFAAAWGLSDVAIIGGNTANLGRNDTINLFNAAGVLVDQLAYGDQTYPGTVRTQNKSCNIPGTDYAYTIAQGSWILASDDDMYGSRISTRGEVGSPGRIVGYSGRDFDRDGDVDLDDFAALVCVLFGPDVSYLPVPSGCPLTADANGFVKPDADEDGDVDLADIAAFQLCFSGADNAADPTCGRDWVIPGPTQITLNGNSISVTGSNVTVSGTKATITAQGTYYIIGTLNDGQIVVDSVDSGVVEIVFSGVNISNSTTAPFYVMNAGNTALILADGTTNTLTDPATYIYDPGVDEPNACLHSKDYLSISGTGALTVHGNYNDGITGKDDLLITGGTITVVAVDDGIRGKDSLTIQGGTFNVTSGGDGLKSDNEEDPELGVISISDGTFHITSGGDAIAAQTDVNITGGNFTIVSGGGHTATLPADLSAKGVKGLVDVHIGGGTFNIDSADDGVHSNASVRIDAGTLNIATADDAVHSDAAVVINNGTIIITHSFEGIEGGTINIVTGDIHIVSSDDAITADTTVTIAGGDYTIVSGGGHLVTIPSTKSAKAIKGLTSVSISGGTFSIDSADDGVHSNSAVTISGGTLTMAVNSSTSAGYGDGVHADGSIQISNATITVNPCYEGIESPNTTINSGTIHVTSTDDGINGAGGAGSANYLHINGGYIYVNAQGDGIDVNGSIWMTGGTVIVNGPTQDNNAAIDYDVSFNISGGLLVAAGSAGMAQAPSTSSTQRSVKVTYSASKTAGTIARIQTAAGVNIVTFAPAKTYRSLVVSSPSFTSGLSCELYRGGTCTGTVLDGLYSGGTYSGGTRTNTFSTNSAVTNVNAP